MTIKLHLKDPDGVYDSISKAVETSLVGSDLSEAEAHEVSELRREKFQDALKPWIQYGEYLEVEINTDTKETKVLRQS